MTSPVFYCPNVETFSPALAEIQRHFPRRLEGDRLLVRGSCCGDARFRVGIVGTRHPSPSGVRFVQAFVPRLKELGALVVSGGALGIDGEAHAAALRAGIPTEAWLVGPSARPSPRFHARMFEAIATRPECGLIVPESLEPKPGLTPQKHNWIQRNQWLVARCQALVVIEARQPSGTWSSVLAANDFGIPIYLLSGAWDAPQSQGINQMISYDYGQVVVSVEDLTQRLIVDLNRGPYNQIRP